MTLTQLLTNFMSRLPESEMYILRSRLKAEIRRQLKQQAEAALQHIEKHPNLQAGVAKNAPTVVSSTLGGPSPNMQNEEKRIEQLPADDLVNE